MKAAKWPGLPERLRVAFEQAGYWKDGRPDVLGFTRRTGFLTGYAYKYLSGETVPDRENLFKISALLDTTPQWLLFGDAAPASRGGKKGGRAMHPIAGGSDADLRHYVNQFVYWLWSVRPSRRWAMA